MSTHFSPIDFFFEEKACLSCKRIKNLFRYSGEWEWDGKRDTEQKTETMNDWKESKNGMEKLKSNMIL